MKAGSHHQKEEPSRMSSLTATDLLAIRATALSQSIGDLKAALIRPTSKEELLSLCEPIAEAITDAIAAGDVQILAIIEHTLSELLGLTSEPVAVVSRLDTLRDMAKQARARRVSAVTTLEVGSHAHRFLRAVVRNPGLGNAQIGASLGVTSPALVSRTGGRLEDEGLVRRVRRGRNTLWYPTPHGTDLLGRLDHSEQVVAPTNIPAADCERLVQVFTDSAAALVRILDKLDLMDHHERGGFDAPDFIANHGPVVFEVRIDGISGEELPLIDVVLGSTMGRDQETSCHDAIVRAAAHHGPVEVHLPERTCRHYTETR